jgi:hypothetical protein
LDEVGGGGGTRICLASFARVDDDLRFKGAANPPGPVSQEGPTDIG